VTDSQPLDAKVRIMTMFIVRHCIENNSYQNYSFLPNAETVVKNLCP